MSLEYCHECDKMIDLDWNAEHEHFIKQMKGGGDNDRRKSNRKTD